MFEVARYEHPEIFVISRRTAETYRFLVGDDGTLAHGAMSFEQNEAWKTAIAYLARISRSNAA
jgi:hypothetical protein